MDLLYDLFHNKSNQWSLSLSVRHFEAGRPRRLDVSRRRRLPTRSVRETKRRGPAPMITGRRAGGRKLVRRRPTRFKLVAVRQASTDGKLMSGSQSVPHEPSSGAGEVAGGAAGRRDCCRTRCLTRRPSVRPSDVQCENTPTVARDQATTPYIRRILT